MSVLYNHHEVEQKWQKIWDEEGEAFNFEKSEYTMGLHEGDIGIIRKLVLSKKKLSYVGTENNIFALKEKNNHLFCTEIAKDMIEAAGIKDIRFTELPVE